MLHHDTFESLIKLGQDNIQAHLIFLWEEIGILAHTDIKEKEKKYIARTVKKLSIFNWQMLYMIYGMWQQWQKLLDCLLLSLKMFYNFAHFCHCYC